MLFCDCVDGNVFFSEKWNCRGFLIYTKYTRQLKVGRRTEIRNTVLLLQSVILSSQYCLLPWIQSVYSLDRVLCLPRGNTTFPFQFPLLLPHGKVSTPDTLTVCTVKSLRLLWWEQHCLVCIRNISCFPMSFHHSGV